LDLREENEDIRKLCPRYKPESSESVRISFFKTRRSVFVLEHVDEEAFLGYAVCKRDAIPPTPGICPKGDDEYRVYESVIRSSFRENNYIRGAPSWKVRVGKRVFRVTGYMYGQQNGVTNSCAHVAVRAAATRFIGGDLSYRQINKWVRSFRKKTGRPPSPPNEGLDSQEICHVLMKAGASTVVGDYSHHAMAPVPYQKVLYGSIESGYPAILFFGTGRGGRAKYHTVPLFGHTFNEDIWVADADLMYFPIRKATKSLSSITWLSMFIGHDDNAGSNYCIPQQYVEGKRTCVGPTGRTIYCRRQRGGVVYAIGTLPHDVQVNSMEAEAIGADYLLAVMKQMPKGKPGLLLRWQKRLADYRKEGLLVLRAILINGSQYASHLRACRGWSGGSRFPGWVAEIIADHVSATLFWMIELSVPELFSANRRKVGEILIRADSEATSERDFTNFYCARIPGWFAFLQHLKAVDGRTTPTFLYVPAHVEDHVPLLGSEKGNGFSRH
jgi:hypothetical protein